MDSILHYLLAKAFVQELQPLGIVILQICLQDVMIQEQDSDNILHWFLVNLTVVMLRIVLLV